MQHQKEHSGHTPLARLHGALQHVFQRQNLLRRAVRDDAKQLSRELHRADPHAPRQRAAERETVGRWTLRPRHPEGQQGHQAAFDPEEARPQARLAGQRPRGGHAEPRGVQPLPEALLDAGGRGAVLQRRLPPSRSHLFLHRPPLRHRARGGGRSAHRPRTLLRRDGLALRDGIDARTAREERFPRRQSEGLRPRLCRLSGQEQPHGASHPGPQEGDRHGAQPSATHPHALPAGATAHRGGSERRSLPRVRPRGLRQPALRAGVCRPHPSG